MWTLHSYKPNKDYNSITYFWVEDGIVKHQRDIASIGFIPIHMQVLIGAKLPRGMGIRKVKTKRTQEELSKGWL